MAITTNTFKVNAGWGKSDVITQMEQAMTYLGWQGGEISGYIVGIGTIWGGGDTNAADIYESVSQKSTSGVGTNATFYIYRDTNTVRYVLPMMPGEGYASGDIVTIDADDIGGFSNGATDLSFRVCVDEIVTNGATLSVAMTSITYTGVLGEGRIYWEGTDRNGVVSPGSTTFTIREGDTISIGNSYSASWSPSICLNNYWQRVDADGPEDGVISGQNIYLGLNESYNFTPKLGQRGEYIFRSSDAAYFAEAGRIIIEPWQGDPGDRTTVGFGTTSSFLQKNLDGGVNGPWAVQKHVINPN